jgi:hypothetical protein
MLKAQLYDLMKLNKRCRIAQILAKDGTYCIETSAVHANINHIELIWTDVKQWVASKN